jgi:hypothetical protein
MAIESRCSSLSRSLDEPVHATASSVRGWVLVEQPGPWGSEALVQSRLPKDVGRDLGARAQGLGVRVLLLRNPDRPPPEAVRQCYVAYSGRRGPFIEERVVSDPQELLSLDLDRLGKGQPPGFGTIRRAPLYLVCTNGRHDPCCAHFGRPVVRALYDQHEAKAWECSHFGGDRFAGNLVCLPHGLYFGRLGPEEAARVVERYEQGYIELDYFRGRAGDHFAVQAAEFFLRRAEGLLGVDDVTPVHRRVLDGGVVQVELSGAGGSHFEVQVRLGAATAERTLTCAAVTVEHPATYSLVSIRSP